MNEHTIIADKAFKYGMSHFPDAPIEHYAAFANAVTYAMTGTSGNRGGPSMRERLANHMIVRKFGCEVGMCTFEKTVNLIENCCFGPLTMRHAKIYASEHCFDDAPGEAELAKQLLKESNTPARA